jgi:hypothetical protein
MSLARSILYKSELHEGATWKLEAEFRVRRAAGS